MLFLAVESGLFYRIFHVCLRSTYVLVLKLYEGAGHRAAAPDLLGKRRRMTCARRTTKRAAACQADEAHACTKGPDEDNCGEGRRRSAARRHGTGAHCASRHTSAPVASLSGCPRYPRPARPRAISYTKPRLGYHETPRAVLCGVRFLLAFWRPFHRHLPGARIAIFRDLDDICGDGHTAAELQHL